MAEGFNHNALFNIKPVKKSLLAKIAGQLMARFPDDSQDLDERDLVGILSRLLVEKDFRLPDGAVDADDFQVSFVDAAEKAIKTALDNSQQPGLVSAAILGAKATKWLLNKYNRCGGIDRGNPSEGPAITTNDVGLHVVRYYIEEETVNGKKQPKLPEVKGSRKLARSILSTAFTTWELFLKIDVVRTGDLADANLIVTAKKFTNPPTPQSVLALTDIGPPGGLNGTDPLRLRMEFDSGETYDTEQSFQATAAHEFGHALGIRHANVLAPGQLMNDTLSDVTWPQTKDLEAAVKLGWNLL